MFTLCLKNLCMIKNFIGINGQIDALHNSAFLFPVVRKRGYGCINFQNSTGKGGRTRSKQ